MPPPGGMDPEALRLQMGLSKEEMIAKFGNPQPPQPQQNFMQAGFQQFYQPQGSISTGGLPAQGDPNAVAQQYASQKGISLEQAKSELKAQHGDPTQPQVSTASTSSQTFTSFSYAPPPMPDHKEVHHNDKKWLKDFHRSHPGTSRADARNAFYAQHGRMPE